LGDEDEIRVWRYLVWTTFLKGGKIIVCLLCILVRDVEGDGSQTLYFSLLDNLFSLFFFFLFVFVICPHFVVAVI